MTAFVELAPYWLILSGLYVTMVFGGGIEWLHRRDLGAFKEVPVAIWKRVHHVVWLVATGTFVLGMIFS